MDHTLVVPDLPPCRCGNLDPCLSFEATGVFRNHSHFILGSCETCASGFFPLGVVTVFILPSFAYFMLPSDAFLLGSPVSRPVESSRVPATSSATIILIPPHVFLLRFSHSGWNGACALLMDMRGVSRRPSRYWSFFFSFTSYLQLSIKVPKVQVLT
jgi:hypothetical protein